MIADGRQLQTEEIQSFNGRFIMVRRRDERTCTDDVTRTDNNVIRIPTQTLGNVGSQVIDPAHYNRRFSHLAGELSGGLKIPVKVIESHDLDGYRCRFHGIAAASQE